MIGSPKITGFDWDEENSRKNQEHDVSMAESEQVYLINRCWCLKT
jgi:uncharacterized DUF497 family protein